MVRKWLEEWGGEKGSLKYTQFIVIPTVENPIFVKNPSIIIFIFFSKK